MIDLSVVCCNLGIMSTGHFGRAVPVGLRRFPILIGRTLAGSKVSVPSELKPSSAPLHVMTVNFKNKHVWNARTWAGLHSSVELLLQHAGMIESPEHRPGMYHVWLLPTVHWLWSPLWKQRCRGWAKENGIPEENVIVVYGNRDEISEDIGIFNDGRQYAFLLDNDGKVHFATDGRYLSHKHDFSIHKAVQTLIRQSQEIHQE
jgi:hypothetical protein